MAFNIGNKVRLTGAYWRNNPIFDFPEEVELTYGEGGFMWRDMLWLVTDDPDDDWGAVVVKPESPLQEALRFVSSRITQALTEESKAITNRDWEGAIRAGAAHDALYEVEAFIHQKLSEGVSND